MMGMLGGLNGMRFEKIGQYTVGESWENDTKGNPITIGQTVLDGYVNGFNVYVLAFKNNNSSNQNYRVDSIYYPIADLSEIKANMYGFCIRGTNVVRQLATGISSWASQGTTIDIYIVVP